MSNSLDDLKYKFDVVSHKYGLIKTFLRKLILGGTIKNALGGNVCDIVFYGVTDYAEIFIDECTKEGLNVLAVSDKRILSENYTYNNIKFLSPDDFVKDYKSVMLIILVLKDSDSIKTEFLQKGFKNVVTFEDLLYKM